MIFKAILTGTAIGAVVIASPIVFCVGRIVGRGDAERAATGPSDAPLFAFPSHKSKWTNAQHADENTQ